MHESTNLHEIEMFAFRPVSSTQKPSFLGHVTDMAILIHWTDLMIKASGAELIGFSVNAREAALNHIHKQGVFLPEGMDLESFNIVLNWFSKLTDDPVLHEFFQTQRSSFSGLNFTFEHSSPNVVTLDSVPIEITKYHMLRDHLTPPIHLILFDRLYLLDILAIITNNNGRGIRVPRFLPFYPTISGLREIIKHRVQIIIGARMMMQKHDLAVEQLTRENIKAGFEEYWAQKQLKNKSIESDEINSLPQSTGISLGDLKFKP